jgi:hypothetical protein
VTATEPVVLTSASGTLTLALDEKGIGGWCQARLLAAGAERLMYIAAQLAAFLADSAPGQRWIFSLSELHTSAYGEHVDGATIIALQDSDAKWFATLLLTSGERSEWLRQSSRYMEPWRTPGLQLAP